MNTRIAARRFRERCVVELIGMDESTATSGGYTVRVQDVVRSRRGGGGPQHSILVYHTLQPADL